MRTSFKTLYLAALITGILFLVGCARATPSTPTVNPEDILTQAAGTVVAQLTEVAALTPSPIPATPTIPPTSTPFPTVAAVATLPPPAANTLAPTSPSAQTEDAASFVDDVTVPDGTGAAPGIQFEKIWRIKNTGKTTWTTTYSLAYVDGERMGAPDSIAMPKEVRPGETVDIAVKLTAPAQAGSYQTFFRLRNAGGQYFRLDGSGDLWVKISVGGASPTPDLTQTVSAESTATEAPTE